MSEKRLNSAQFKKLLIEYNSQNPEILEKEEFEHWLDDHILTRHDLADKLLTEVQKELKELSKALPSKGKDLELAIKKIEDAAIYMTHGAAGYNKAATGKLVLLKR